MSYKVNVKANLDAMVGKSRFVDVKGGKTVIFRLTPPTDDSGIIFYPVLQHWKLKDLEGNGTALANLGMHGNDETGRQDYIEELSEVLRSFEDEKVQDIGDLIKGNVRYWAQGSEGKLSSAGVKYSNKVQLLAVPKTVATLTINIIQNQEEMHEPTLVDPEQGLPIIVKGTGTGLKTRYSVDRGSQPVPLADIFGADWESKTEKNIYDALNLKIHTREVQKQLAQFTYPGLDWELLEKEYGL